MYMLPKDKKFPAMMLDSIYETLKILRIRAWPPESLQGKDGKSMSKCTPTWNDVSNYY
jgi:hypothetical protein